MKPTQISSCRVGASVVELLVVIAILSGLIALLLPVVASTREKGRQAGCAANLHRLGQAFFAYTAENNGWVPRNPAQGYKNHPMWPVVIAKYFRREPLQRWQDIPGVRSFRCPSHPTADIPSAYVLNAFSFETRTAPLPWWGSPAVRISGIKGAASLPWLLETPDFFPGMFSGSVMDEIYQEQEHGVYKPDHLVGASRARVSETRHRYSSNVCFADGHVAAVKPKVLSLEQFDDGIRVRDWD